MPDFSDAQKMVIWTALSQFVENCQEAVEFHLEDPEAHPLPKGYSDAEDALELLDAWVAEMALSAPPAPLP